MKWLFVAALMALPMQAIAKHQCEPSQNVTNILTDKYGERILGVTVFDDGVTVQFWANAETGTWTVIGVLSTGISCPLLAGQQWNGTLPLVFEPVVGGIGRNS